MGLPLSLSTAAKAVESEHTLEGGKKKQTSLPQAKDIPVL